MLEIAKKFQADVIAWLENIEKNSIERFQIQKFFADSATEKFSKKNQFSREISFPKFSVLRLYNKDHKAVFLIVGHNQIGEPGSFGQIKMALPLEYDETSETVSCKTYLPVALKIIRSLGMDDQDCLTPSLSALEIAGECYPEVYAFTRRSTDSKKSRYSKSSSNDSKFSSSVPSMQNELSCNQKKYISMPLFNAVELFQILLEHGNSGTGLGLAGDEVITILLGVLTQLSNLHKKGVIHRDIKLDNILYNPNTKGVHIIDLDDCAPIGSVKRIVGTEAYFHEEINAIIGSTVYPKIMTVRTYDDLYAFAVMLDFFLQTQIVQVSEYEKFEPVLFNLSKRIKEKFYQSADEIINYLNNKYPHIRLSVFPQQEFALDPIKKTISLKSAGIVELQPKSSPEPFHLEAAISSPSPKRQCVDKPI